MGLHLAVYTAIGGRLLADWTSRARDLLVTTNNHGFATCTGFIPMSPPEAFSWFDRPGLPWVQVNAPGVVAWEGRLEDVRLMAGGISIVALGAYSVFGDVPYTDTPASPTTSDAIVADVLIAAAADNPALISDETYLIEAPGVNVYDEEYEDEAMPDILNRMVALGDSQTPPRQWEVGVWENLRLHFRPRGSAGRTWYIDVVDPEIERSISQVWNSAYTRYDGGVTATADDDASITRYGITRRAAISSRTTDLTQAERERDATLADRATPLPRASIPIGLLYTAAGTITPKWLVRSGDTIIIRNLPPETGELIDRIRSFRVSETRYRPDGDVLEIVPEAPLPTLEVLTARALEVPR